MFIILLLNFALASDPSYTLIDLEGKIIEKKKPDEGRYLASISKIYSLYYSLSILGADFRFETNLAHTGKIKNGILKGDLYLIGGGDPYLTTAHLTSMVHSLSNKGIKKIEGSFYYDDSLLPFTQRLDPIGLEDQTDNPSMSALNVEFNRFRKVGKHRLPPTENMSLKPAKLNSPGLKFKNNGDDSWSYSTEEKLKWLEEVPSRNSSKYTAEFFRYLARVNGIALSEPKFRKANNFEVITRIKSLPLLRIAELSMEYSNNLMAEMPMLMASKQIWKSKLKWELVGNIMKKKLIELHPNNDWKMAYFVNGSGLSLGNKSSAKNLATFLKDVHGKEFAGRSYPSILSIGGANGWMKRRFLNEKYAYRVVAKTGSLHYVNNIAGYLTAKSGKTYAFALMMQDRKKREKLNGPNSKENAKLREAADSWHRSMKSKQDQLIRQWIDKY